MESASAHAEAARRASDRKRGERRLCCSTKCSALLAVRGSSWSTLAVTSCRRPAADRLADEAVARSSILAYSTSRGVATADVLRDSIDPRAFRDEPTPNTRHGTRLRVETGPLAHYVSGTLQPVSAIAGAAFFVDAASSGIPAFMRFLSASRRRNFTRPCSHYSPLASRSRVPRLRSLSAQANAPFRASLDSLASAGKAPVRSARTLYTAGLAARASGVRRQHSASP